MGLAGRGNRLERLGFDFRAAPVTMPVAMIFPTIETNGFDHCFTYHAAAILRQDFTDTIAELNGIVGGIAIPIVELVRGGGGEVRVTQRLRKTFQEHGWTLLKTSRFWEENDSIGGGVILGEASCHNQVFGILKIGFVG